MENPDPAYASPFLGIPGHEYVAENDLAFAVRDRFPVSPGHTLVIPRRLVSQWWDTTTDEQRAILALVDQVRADLLDDGTRAELVPGLPIPDGFNVGFNAGSAAGQTVDHLHVHVIPRYSGDMADPRGGVRHVIPAKGNYLKPLAVEPRIHDAPARPLRSALLDAVSDPSLNTAAFAASFVLSSGLRVLDPIFDEVLQRADSSVRVLTTDYFGVTEKSALETLLRRQEEFGKRFKVRVFLAGTMSFHPKAYILTNSLDTNNGVVFVGSANASQHGLVDGHEWTMESQSAGALSQALDGFESLWNDERSIMLDRAFISSYNQAVRPTQSPDTQRPVPLDADSSVAMEPLSQPVTPTALQRQALEALEQSRAQGYRAGLVAMATGLGKTWLAAFDSSRPEFRRVLFVAHREEILQQARTVFRQVVPDASIGWLGGGIDERSADIVMASVQTLTSKIEEFTPEEFDYVVIDEFHHASAPSYRRVINRLEPRFLLGITATPQRTDRADLLALCEDNLVFECSLGEGIEQQQLSPFHYFGVPDPVDFQPLPWRSGRFDPTALESALIAANRSDAAFREWTQRRGSRTLAFCVSQRHADWMRDYFVGKGIRAASVHTGSTSAPREQTLVDLRNGDLDVVFSVDLFNEGTDVPEIDTVLMLRPTQSPILFMQQIGRGLRKSADKDALTIIDFVGNHRSFLLPLRIMSGLVDPTITESTLRRALETDTIALPPGCSVDYQLEAKETILRLLPSVGTRITAFANAWNAERGERPTALESYLAGFNPTTAKPNWFAALADEGLLADGENRVWRRHHDLLNDIASTAMTKSFKMVALRALISDSALATGTTIDRLASLSRQIMLRDPRLRDDVSSKEIGDLSTVSVERWKSYWLKFPLTHLQTGGEFVLDGDIFRLVSTPDAEDTDTLEAMVSELCDWRLAAYLDRSTKDRILMKVSHSSGEPILRFDRNKQPDIPEGRAIPVEVNGENMLFDFMKIAVNVARRDPNGSNVLPEIMREWFGPDAGLPGTEFRVELRERAGEWSMLPYQNTDPTESLRVAN